MIKSWSLDHCWIQRGLHETLALHYSLLVQNIDFISVCLLYKSLHFKPVFQLSILHWFQAILTAVILCIGQFKSWMRLPAFLPSILCASSPIWVFLGFLCFSRNLMGLHQNGLEIPQNNNGILVEGKTDSVSGRRIGKTDGAVTQGMEAPDSVDGGIRVAGGEDSRFRNARIRPEGMCPYVLNDDNISPPASPFHRCKSPFVPSFKKVTKMLAFPSFLWARMDAFMDRLSRWGKNADGLVEHLWSHMKLGGSVSGTVLGKLRVGTKIVTRGGIENLFRLNFTCGPAEKLLKTSACYLSISSGPIAGLLFISTDKLAFCSDRPISFRAKNGKIGTCYYRVAIPHGRLKCVNPSEKTEKPTEKYIQVETVDAFEFWFMGFVHYDKALRHLQELVSR